MILSEGQIIGGRYEILDKIGQGGMSIVYRAKDMRLGRNVTFKVLKEQHLSDDEFVMRFKSEASAIAKLSHPNIVNVYDVGQEGNINYIVMEYIKGATLKELIDKSAPFKDREIFGVAIQIAEALEHAHKNGIIHRDIKPQNVLVTTGGTIKVMDFGIARTVNSDTITMGGSTMGSVHYFSPEQAKGSVVNFQSDLYSLGIVMFEMATGQLPFDAKEPVSIAVMHLNDPLPDIKEKNPKLSNGLVKIIHRLTEKKPSARYQTAEDLSLDLKRIFVNPDEVIALPKTVEDSKCDTIVVTPMQIEKIREELNNITSRDGRALLDDEDENLNIDEELRTELEDEPRKSSKRQEVLIVLAALLTSAVIIVLALYFLLPIISNNINPSNQVSENYVEAPELIGFDLEAATVIAENLDLKVEVLKEEYSDLAEGQIIDQNYDEGATLLKGTTIGVKVSKGSDKTVVPDFLNMDYDEAYELAESKLLYVSPKYEYSETTAKSIVMAQSVEKDEEVEAGTEIVLTVSKGAEIKLTKIPNILDLTEDEAKMKIVEAKLTIGSVSKGESSKYASKKVMSQSIEADREVEEGTIISFMVSSGPPPATPAPTETPPTETAKPSARSLRIEYAVPADKESVNITILKKTEDVFEEIYNINHVAADFPLIISVTGEGIVDFIMYVDGAAAGSQELNFDE